MSIFKNIFGKSEEENSSKINWKPLTSVDQLDEIITESNKKTIGIFKHSTRCIISKTALRQFENGNANEQPIDFYYLDLLNHRDISNEIANRFNVIHESPQLILIKDGKAIGNASHYEITQVDLQQFVN